MAQRVLATSNNEYLAVLYLGVELANLVLLLQRATLGLVTLGQRLQQLILHFAETCTTRSE